MVEVRGGIGLLDEARAGNEEAFATLLVPLLLPAYRLSLGMLQASADAEDAVQEAVVKAWRKLHQFREGTELRPWFLAIVANQCRSQLRRSWRTTLSLNAAADMQTTAGDGLVEAIELRRAIRRLRPPERLAIVLHYYLDMPVAEMARTLGVSPAAAKARLHRAVRRLRPLLDTEEVDA